MGGGIFGGGGFRGGDYPPLPSPALRPRPSAMWDRQNDRRTKTFIMMILKYILNHKNHKKLNFFIFLIAIQIYIEIMFNILTGGLTSATVCTCGGLTSATVCTCGGLTSATVCTCGGLTSATVALVNFTINFIWK